MSTLSQFATSGIGTSLTLTNFIIKSVQFCGSYQYARNVPLGTRIEGGFIICRSSGTAWIVSPRFTEVSRTWYCIGDANTVANSCTSCTGWFVPTCAQLQNPGYICRTYLESCSLTNYWSSTECDSTNGWLVNFTTGAASTAVKTTTCCVRAFRCVTY
jgi:hypothetical protein